MKSFIFDFDGVLADTFEPLTKFYQIITFKTYAQAKVDVSKMFTRNRPEMWFQRVVKYIIAETFLLYVKRTRKHILFQQRIEEISKLPNPKAILSSNFSSVCRQLLGPKQKIFDAILGERESDTKIQGLLLLFNDSRFKPENCIFITDTLGDVLEVQKILPDMQIYGVSWGYHSADMLGVELSTTHILKDFKSLHKL